MKSTGEVMGIDSSFGKAFAKSQIATGIQLPTEGTVFISVKDSDKPWILSIAKSLTELGYSLMATCGTAKFLSEHDYEVRSINKVKEGSPHIVEAIESQQVAFLINTTFGEQAIKDSYSLRRASLTENLPYCTTISGAMALVEALKAVKESGLGIAPLQEYFEKL